MLSSNWVQYWSVLVFINAYTGLTKRQVPLNPAFGSHQVVSALTHLSASHFIISRETNLPFKPPRSNEGIFKEITADPETSKLVSTSVPSLTQMILVDNSSGREPGTPYRSFTRFRELLNASPSAGDPIPCSPLDPFDVVNIQFTSGTTSMPKAACLSHRSILNNGKQIGSRMLLTPSDRVVCPPPLFHCFGCILGYMATATHGSSIIFPAEAFSPSASLKAVVEEKATALYGVPTMFVSELDLLASTSSKDEYPAEGLSHLRTGIAAGSSIPAELMRKLHKNLNLTELTICYGMTETSPVSFMTTTDDPIDKRVHTVGRALPHVRAKIVDPLDRSRILNTGERGELVVSGYLTMRGYWNDQSRTDEVLIKNDTEAETEANVHDPTRDTKTNPAEYQYWMHTGDEASMDPSGYVTITGRIKDLIIRGGENIHPLEIENCLLSHDLVSDASVVGIPDKKYGEVVGAFVILNKNNTTRKEQQEQEQDKEKEEEERIATQLRSHIGARLSHHLIPKYIAFVHEFPKTASGKVQKFRLREVGVEIFGSEVQESGVDSSRAGGAGGKKEEDGRSGGIA